MGFFILAMACEVKKKELTKENLIGQWESFSIKIELRSAFNESDSTIEADEDNWVETFNIKPIITTYMPGGIYKLDFYSPSGNNIRTDFGNWYIDGDTLRTIIEMDTISYHVELYDDKSRFVRNLDWDLDGDRDDRYDAIQIKIE